MNGQNTPAEKVRKSRNIAWAVCIISFCMIFNFAAISAADWYPDQILQGWPVVISMFVCLGAFIVAINQSVKYSKMLKMGSTYGVSDNVVPGAQTSPVPKNNSANSIVSLVCAVVPLVLFLYTFIFAISSQPSSQYGLILFIYYCTIGFPLVLVWLICGILGLKSKKSTMAAVSLIIKPVGTMIFLILFMIFL